jgi:uncharacterized membrane protein (UPF0127 family)
LTDDPTLYDRSDEFMCLLASSWLRRNQTIVCVMRPRLPFLAPGIRSSSNARDLLRSLALVFFMLAAMRGSIAQEKLEALTIETSSGKHPFVVEVMRTGPQRERGLMFRRFLPDDRGMLFDFKSEQPLMMWMKNTYLPLDMIFISRSGKVVGIAQNTEPLSERIISSGAPASAVLEVNAGTVIKIGLGIGDKIRHPLFGE